MGIDLRNELSTSSITIIIVKKEEYVSKIFQVLKELNSIYPKTLYVSLTQPYKSIIERFKKNSLSDEKFTFLDVLTNTVREPDKEQNCVFVSSPSALTELSVAFSKVINDKKCDIALFDSILTLTIYEDSNSVMKFVHNILTKSQVLNTKAVFVCLKEDKDTDLVKDLYMFADKVIDLSSE